MDHHEEFTLKYLEEIGEMFYRFENYSGHYDLGLFKSNRNCNDLFEFLEAKADILEDIDEEENIYEEL